MRWKSSTKPSMLAEAMLGYGGGICGTSWFMYVFGVDGLGVTGHCNPTFKTTYEAPTLVTGIWHHFAGTTDPTGTRIYLDGLLAVLLARDHLREFVEEGAG